MFAYPVQKVDSHCWSFITKSLSHILKNIFNSNTMTELIKSIESFFNHLSSFLSKLSNNIENLSFSRKEEIFSQSFSHNSSNFESTNNNIKITVINQPSNKLCDMSKLWICYFWNRCSFHKLLHRFYLLIPFLCFQYWIRLLVIVLFKYLNSLWQFICI